MHIWIQNRAPLRPLVLFNVIAIRRSQIPHTSLLIRANAGTTAAPPRRQRRLPNVMAGSRDCLCWQAVPWFCGVVRERVCLESRIGYKVRQWPAEEWSCLHSGAKLEFHCWNGMQV